MARSTRKTKSSSKSPGKKNPTGSKKGSRSRSSKKTRGASTSSKKPKGRGNDSGGVEEAAFYIDGEDEQLEVARKERKGLGSRGKEVTGVLLLAAALLAGASLFSLQFGDGTLMGPFGRAVALGLYAILGMAGYLVVSALGLMALRYLTMARKRSDWLMWLGYGGATISSAVIIHCLYPNPRLHGFTAGGKTGEIVGEFLLALFSSAGTYLIASIGLLISLIIATDISIVEAVTTVLRLFKAITRNVSETAVTTGSFLRRTFSWKSETTLAADGGNGASINMDAGNLDDEKDGQDSATENGSGAERASNANKNETDQQGRKEKTSTGGDASQRDDVTSKEGVASDESAKKDEKITDPSLCGARKRGPGPQLPKIIERKKVHQKKASPDKALQIKPIDSSDYELPRIDLLQEPNNDPDDTDSETMLNLARRLEVTLKDYGINGRIREIHPGPVVTMYEFAPERGTKLSKITALSSDLAMSMEATKVRIVAPIPGKNAVGIEIPNRTRETVYLRELLEDMAFYKGNPKLRMALGKDINGNSSYCDMAKAPHLLIAGATGAGKSVGVHAMILSLLYQYTPEHLRLLLIDPKMLEFSCYHDIPHLLHPVVTDPQQANLALRWAVEEMESRYQKLAELGVRDLESFNRKVQRLQDETEKRKREEEEKENDMEQYSERDSDDGSEDGSEDISSLQDESLDEVEIIEEDIAEPATSAPITAGGKLFSSQSSAPDQPPEKLPYVVIIIDEFADLMMASPKEVETSVARIAQKARAAGIHLVVATQRPSTDVITGLIRANFPTRVAYQVSSKVDSRVVLEQHGAESLLGMGDMLFSNRGLAPKRAHGPFVDTEEIDRVVEHIKDQARPNYNMEIVKPSLDDGSSEEDEPVDPKYDQAVAIVSSQRNASISFLQRKLRVGYNRAARMIEMMEKEGVVGPSDGVKGREVLVGSFDD